MLDAAKTRDFMRSPPGNRLEAPRLADSPTSVLFGALTGILSVVPMVGTGVVWGSLSIYLAVTGHIWKAVILAIWGLVLVHPTDNILRPLLISNATRVPFLLVMFGVFGGMAAFGLVRALVGPIILAMGLAAWREWAIET